jgi:catechol 2,3-dioxygenase-like lactoylglutathione lyase family enzyme
MTKPPAPQVDCEQQHPALRVEDVAAAVDFYTTRLGFHAGFTWGDPPTMAGLNLGSVQMFLEQGTPSPGGCAVYFVVGNADELYEFQRANGVEIMDPPGDRPYGLRDYRIRDLHGYELGFGHHLFNTGPAIVIDRVEFRARIEKRLAALFQELAEYKRMTVGSCLEETLLHTLEGVGPHTKTDLRHIEQLKRKHGIDYDSHASYRFAEREGGTTDT